MLMMASPPAAPPTDDGDVASLIHDLTDEGSDAVLVNLDDVVEDIEKVNLTFALCSL